MRLIESDPSLAAICRLVEVRLQGVASETSATRNRALRWWKIAENQI